MRISKYMKFYKLVIAFLVVSLLLISIDNLTLTGFSESNNTSLVDENVFPHNKVIDVSITINEDNYQDMLENPTAENYYSASVDYNGFQFSNIGIRTKGNSSLRSVANMDSDRYSLKLDLDYFIDDQNLYGIKNLNLNNLYADSTMMAEYIGYEIMAELGTAAPRTTYTALYINGEYFGLYLCVEQVEESFLINHYGNANGELYKPYMGSGCNLEYISDIGSDYSGLECKTSIVSNNQDLVTLVKTIDQNGDLEEILNVDSFLKYLAMSSATIHLDAYQGGMFHNYYLYNNNGKFEWITWDLNMIFNRFPKGPAEPEVFDFLIDEPVLGSMDQYPLIEAILSNDEYVERYHSYLQQLIDGYLADDSISNRVLEIYEMINSYIKTDPTSFYSYQEFEDALFTDKENKASLLTFIKNRNESISQQLSGAKTSTNNGAGNISSKKMTGNKNDIGMGPPQGDKQLLNQADMDQGKQPAMGQEREIFQFDTEGNVILPDGITLDDIPQEIRAYLERGETPPIEMVKQNISNMPPELMPQREMNPNKQNEQQGGVKPNKQNGQQERMPNMGRFPQFDDEGNVILPEGISMDDIPENIREYLEQGESPPIEMLRAFLDSLPAEMKDKLMRNTPDGMSQDGMKRNNQVNNQQVNSQNTLPNLLLIGVGVIAMLGFVIYLKRK